MCAQDPTPFTFKDFSDFSLFPVSLTSPSDSMQISFKTTRAKDTNPSSTLHPLISLEGWDVEADKRPHLPSGVAERKLLHPINARSEAQHLAYSSTCMLAIVIIAVTLTTIIINFHFSACCQSGIPEKDTLGNNRDPNLRYDSHDYFNIYLCYSPSSLDQSDTILCCRPTGKFS